MQDLYLRHVQVSTLLAQPSDMLLAKQTMGIVWKKLDYQEPIDGVYWIHVKQPVFDQADASDGSPVKGEFEGCKEFVALAEVSSHYIELDSGKNEYEFEFHVIQGEKLDEEDVVLSYVEVIAPNVPLGLARQEL